MAQTPTTVAPVGDIYAQIKALDAKIAPLVNTGNPNEILFPFKFGSTDAGNISTAKEFETMLLQATGTLDSQAMTRSVAANLAMS